MLSIARNSKVLERAKGSGDCTCVGFLLNLRVIGWFLYIMEVKSNKKEIKRLRVM